MPLFCKNANYDATGAAGNMFDEPRRNEAAALSFSDNARSNSIRSQLGKSLGAFRCHERLP